MNANTFAFRRPAAFTKTIVFCFTIFALIVSGCAQSTQAPIAVFKGPIPEVVTREQSESLPAGNQAPAGNSAPAVNPPAQQQAPLAEPTSAPAMEPAPLATAGPIVPPAWSTPAPTPADNFFQTYEVNPFIETYYDHLSTFAIDVDTASYSVARRYVEDGSLPPAAAVRVEEFVNYFDAGYPSPENVAFAVYADGAPSPFYNDGTYILRYGVQGYQVPEANRMASTLTFVIDISGSMDMENRLELVKRSLELLVERLRADDSVAIVVYGSSARIALQPTSGADKGTILNAIFNLRTEGATNAEAGLRLGYRLAMQAFRPGTSNRVILCSDGVANVGKTGAEAILAEVHGYVDEGVRLTSVGFGMGNYNDVLLEQLADNGDGNYAYVDSLEEAQKLFVEDLTSTLQVIALDAKIQVDFNPEVVARYRLIGYENRDVADSDFRNDSVDAGEIGAGHSVTALYAVQFQPGAQGRISTVQVRWQDPQTYQVTEINGNFNTWDVAASFDSTSPRYQLAAVVAQYAELLRHSYWAGSTTFSGLNSYAYRLQSLLPEDPEVLEFVNLVARAGQLGLSNY